MSLWSYLFRRRPAERPPGFRPELEVLEDRVVPSEVFTVTNVADNGDDMTPVASSFR